MLSRLLAARQVSLGNHVGAEISDSVPTKSRWVLSCLFVYIRPFTLILYEELNMSVCVCVLDVSAFVCVCEREPITDAFLQMQLK